MLSRFCVKYSLYFQFYERPQLQGNPRELGQLQHTTMHRATAASALHRHPDGRRPEPLRPVHEPASAHPRPVARPNLHLPPDAVEEEATPVPHDELEGVPEGG